MPRLELPDAPLARAAARRSAPEFAHAIEALRAEATKALASPLRPLRRTAGYYHHYFCPDHAAELMFDETKPAEHVCPIDARVWSGPPFDDAWGWTLNRRLAQWAYRLALLSRISDDERYQKRCIDILTAYAREYPTLENPRTGAASVGKVAYSALDESVWVIPIAWASHWMWPDLDEPTRDLLRRNLLEPAARHIESQRTPRIHNYENWLNAALVTLGAALGNWALVERMLDEPFGVRDQLERGVMADGHWYELAPSYHYYTLGAVVALVQAVEDTRLDLRRHPAFRAMYEAPLRIAYPSYHIPATNDCWYHSSPLEEVGHGIPSGPAFYEIATGWFGAPEFNGVLTAAYRQRPRADVEALLYGPDAISPAQPPPMPETNESASGYAVLRPELPAGQPGYVMLKYGPHGGGHGHADKLSLSIFGGGCRWGGDLGTPGYGIPINDTWYRHTLSHQTVLLDGEAQPPAEGELLTFRPVQGNAAGIIDAQVAWEQGAYAAAYARRIVLARAGVLVILTRVEAPVDRRIHVVFHHAGKVIQPPAGASAPARLPENASYAHLGDPQRYPASNGATFAIQAPGDTATYEMTVGMAPMQAGDLVLARSPGNPASDLRLCFMLDAVAAELWTAVALVYGERASAAWTVDADGRPESLITTSPLEECTWAFREGMDAHVVYPIGS